MMSVVEGMLKQAEVQVVIREGHASLCLVKREGFWSDVNRHEQRKSQEEGGWKLEEERQLVQSVQQAQKGR